MSLDPAFTAPAIARRVPLPHARVVLDDARDILRRALAEQPRDRAFRPGPLDSDDVAAAADSVETWTAVVQIHERAARLAPPMREMTLEDRVEPGVVALEFTDGPLVTPCTVRDQYGDEHELTDVAWQSAVEGGLWFATVTVATPTTGDHP